MKEFEITFSDLMKMAVSSSNELKTLWAKEKLIISSNFSFSRSVFKRLVLQTRKNQGLFGKGLKSNLLQVTNSEATSYYVVYIQWIPLYRNPDNGDFRLFATFRLAPIFFPFRQCIIHQIIGTLIKDIFSLLQQKSLHRLRFFSFISNFGT